MNAVDLKWAGGTHPFFLSIGDLRELQRVTDAGPMQILNGLRGGTWRVDWPLTVIRHGLIGGGMPADQARALVTQMEDARPLAEFVFTALLVLSASLVGVADDPVGGSGEGEGQGALNPRESGSSAASTATPPREALAPET